MVGGSRDPDEARRNFPGREFVQFEASDADSVARALAGVSSAIYLIHGMKGSGDYEKSEHEAAALFRSQADKAGLDRVIYLGGVRPAGEVSKHLRSRLETGEELRGGRTPVAELQASMVIGHGSDSFRMVRDLAARLPMMILPRWSESRTEPVSIRDVAQAIRFSLEMPLPESAVFPIPGPQVMTAGETILRTASLLGNRPVHIKVPVLSPTLSGYWLRFVTRTNFHLASELIEGLRSDLLAPDAGLWKLMPAYIRQSFNEAAVIALRAEANEIDTAARQWERLVHRLCKAGDKSARKLDPRST